MTQRLIGTALALACVVATSPVQAQHHHHRHIRPQMATRCVYTNSGRQICRSRIKRTRSHLRVARAASGNVQFISHPRGCPATKFCACGASVAVFGKPIRSLWPARAWYRFPRARPAPGRVAVRPHHVFVLRRHIEGNIWLAADYNSGGHRSRLHARSIAGYTIVNPTTSRIASR